MATLTPQPGEVLELLMETIAPNGKAKGRALAPGWEKLSFFVDGATPGDRLRARVTAAHKRYVEADAVELLAAGPARATPPCPHFGECGGCQLMHLDYAAQLAAKQEIAAYVLRRREAADGLSGPVVASPQPLRYRLRSTVALDARGEPAMQRRRSHDLAAIASCAQMRPELERCLLPAARALAATTRAAHVRGVVDPETGRGFVHPFAAPHDADSPDDWRELAGEEWKPAREPRCALAAAGFRLEYAPDCFTQVNPELNELLIAHAVAALDLTPASRVIEAFAGVGNFTLPTAARAREVVAIERRRGAQFGERNAQTAGLTNVRFLAGDAAALLPALARQGERCDRLLVDPPREGLGQAICTAIGTLRPARLVYVSCEPLTLADDLRRLRTFGYRPRELRGFDMFPQTFHMETCATLEC